MKRTLSILIALVLIAAVIPLGTFAVSAKEVAFGIDKTYLKAGEPLTVNNPDGYTLRYFVGEEEILTDGLTLEGSYYEKWITVRGYDGDELAAEDTAYFSRLPVLYLATDDGSTITSKKEYKSGALFVQSNEQTSSVEYNGAIKIRGRGNTSWSWLKKSYRIKLDKKADLFGMGKNKNWVLLSNYLDECALRNVTAQQLAKELGLVFMENVWTSVILNGEYAGMYLLCEQVRIDETRVDIFDWEEEAENVASAIVKVEKKKGNALDKDALEDTLKEDLAWVTEGSVTFEGVTYQIGDYYEASADITGGYLFELSEEYDELTKFKTENGLKVMLKSPEYLYTNEEMMDYVRQLWQDFEMAYRSEDGYVDTAEGRKHYTEIADFDSMVAFWLVQEIMGNDDAVRKSRFAYIDQSGKLTFGPVWDFDWGCATIKVTYNPTGWKVSRIVNTNAQDEGGGFCFYQQFLDDPLFVVRATEMYWKLRPYLEILIQADGVLDTESEYLFEACQADGVRWDRSRQFKNPAARGFEEDTRVFKQYMRDRVAWLDSVFVSNETIINSTRTSYSTYPYYKSDAKLAMSVVNGGEDAAEHVPANAALKQGKSARVEIAVTDTETDTLNVYINGLYWQALSIEEGVARTILPADLLTAGDGSKNVVSVIGKSADGVTTYRNFLTIACRDEQAAVFCDALSLDHVFTHYTDDGEGGWTAVCDCCDAIDRVTDVGQAQGHNFGEWTPIQEVTCTQQGVWVRTCSFCDEVETRFTTALGHSFIREVRVEPTETENGCVGFKCSRCEEIQIDEVLPATGPSASSEESATIPGDLDGDREVTDDDAIYLLLYTFFPDEYQIDDPDAFDLDGDGDVDDDDAIWLLLYTFFPENYPIS